MVAVYYFRVWDQSAGDCVIPPRKSPADRIARIKGQVISDTCEHVDAADLDDFGRCDPRLLSSVTS